MESAIIEVLKVLSLVFLSCATSMVLFYMAEREGHGEYMDKLEKDHALAEAIRKLRNVEVSR